MADVRRERVATALHGADCGCPDWTYTGGHPAGKDSDDPWYGLLADAVLPVVAQILAEQREAIAVAIEAHRDGWASSHPQDGFRQGLDTAAIIAHEHGDTP